MVALMPSQCHSYTFFMTNRFYRNIFLMLLCAIASYCTQAQTNYYVDAVNGNDLNDGISTNTAWQNLTKLYNLMVTPGSTINLSCGSVWTGQQLKFFGSGKVACAHTRSSASIDWRRSLASKLSPPTPIPPPFSTS